MPDTYRVVLTLSVARELQDIFNYIESDSPDSARRMITRLLQATDSLESFPHRFKVVEETDIDIEIRSMLVKPYLIRYHVNGTSGVVTIVSVRHGARE